MNATSFIADKGLEYAVNILKSAPSNATQWNEGYEFKCGQNAATISPEDKEKYFVDIHELKSVIWSIRRIEALGGIVPARELFEQDKKALDKAFTSENYLDVTKLANNIHDWEKTYIRKGALVDVDFISESRTIYSGKRFSGSGVVDQFDGRNVFGRLNDGTPFMCFSEDIHIHGYEINNHLADSNGGENVL